MRRTHLGPVLSGGRRLLLARLMPALLCVPVAAGPAAVVLSARAPGLLQGGLCKVSSSVFVHVGVVVVFVVAVC